jgi:hypothetical protein
MRVLLLRRVRLILSHALGSRQKLVQAFNELLEFFITGEKALDLGANLTALLRGLLMSKYVVIVLHD